MECMLQWLDELEDLAWCLPMLWSRIRAWLLLALSAALTVLVAPSVPAIAPMPAMLAVLLLASVTLLTGLGLSVLRRPAHSPISDRA